MKEVEFVVPALNALLLIDMGPTLVGSFCSVSQKGSFEWSNVVNFCFLCDYPCLLRVVFCLLSVYLAQLTLIAFLCSHMKSTLPGWPQVLEASLLKEHTQGRNMGERHTVAAQTKCKKDAKFCALLCSESFCKFLSCTANLSEVMCVRGRNGLVGCSVLALKPLARQL